MNAPWIRSSFSFANGNCVEVAELPGGSVGIRDSRDPGGPVLRFTRAEWAAFLGGARRGSGTARRWGQDGTTWDRGQPLLGDRSA